MKEEIRLLLVAGSVLLVGVGTLEGQTLHLGGHASYGTEDFSKAGVGAHATYLVTEDIAGAAALTFHFPGDDITFWDLNVNAHYRFTIDEDYTPYVGGGINYSHISVDDTDFGFGSVSSSEVGLNILAGVFLELANGMRPFGEARFVFSDADQLVLTVGLSLPVGY